jgi:hypothetical protein
LGQEIVFAYYPDLTREMKSAIGSGNLEAKIAARDSALNTWRIEQLYRDQQSGSGEKEARAREQYYRFEAQVLEALARLCRYRI